MSVTSRILPPAEVQRVIDAGGPLKDLQVDPARVSQMTVVVSEVDGQIVGYWLAWYGLHVEPLWIHEAYRKHPGVARGLQEVMADTIAARGEACVFCCINDGDAESMAPYATRLGFHPAPGRLYYLTVQAPAPTLVM